LGPIWISVGGGGLGSLGEEGGILVGGEESGNTTLVSGGIGVSIIFGTTCVYMWF
jgi:hypothetical protein